MSTVLILLGLILLVIVLVSLWTGDTPVVAVASVFTLKLAGYSNDHLVIAALIALVLVVLDLVVKRGYIGVP